MNINNIINNEYTLLYYLTAIHGLKEKYIDLGARMKAPVHDGT